MMMNEVPNGEETASSDLDCDGSAGVTSQNSRSGFAQVTSKHAKYSVEKHYKWKKELSVIM